MVRDNYTKQLEEVIARFLEPVKGIPYRIAIHALTGSNVIPFDRRNPQDSELLDMLQTAATIAGQNANRDGIFRARPNEVGNDIESYVRKALQEVGLKAETPLVGRGRQAAGYPDLEVTDRHGRITYLECKTYNLRNIDTTQRAFYFSPPTKVSKDARHFLLSYQIERAQKQSRAAFIPVHWRLYSLDELNVDLKHEFNASNRAMYQKLPILAESDIGLP